MSSPWNSDIDLDTALNCVYTDLLMLQDGTWTPEVHSVQDSISMVERIAEILNIGLEDTRE